VGRENKRTQTFYTKVAGVTFRNKHFPFTSRQTVIRRYCRVGRNLEVRPEPKNRYSPDALGLWVETSGVIGGTRKHQVGYVPQALALELRARLAEGYTLTGQIDEVVGGMRGLSYGLRVVLTLQEPHTVGERTGMESGAKSAHAPNRIPAATADELMSLGWRVAKMGLAALAIGLLISLWAHRLSDTLGVGVVFSALGAGIWAIGLTFKGEPNAEFEVIADGDEKPAVP
jgi:hypothetical protein